MSGFILILLLVVAFVFLVGFGIRLLLRHSRGPWPCSWSEAAFLVIVWCRVILYIMPGNSERGSAFLALVVGKPVEDYTCKIVWEEYIDSIEKVRVWFRVRSRVVSTA